MNRVNGRPAPASDLALSSPAMGGLLPGRALSSPAAREPREGSALPPRLTGSWGRPPFWMTEIDLMCVTGGEGEEGRPMGDVEGHRELMIG